MHRIPMSHGRFQLTPPRGGDAGLDLIQRVVALVSTHAPARGRLISRAVCQVRLSVSTHAPARGRLLAAPAPVSLSRFQLTPPRGGDLLFFAFRVSPPCFNSRPREGATAAQIALAGAVCKFQLTPPRGGDCEECGEEIWEADGFNSRPREGATPRHYAGGLLRPVVSTHAPARGRLSMRPHPGNLRGFNSRPREGATAPRTGSRTASRFQLTPPRGGDVQCLICADIPQTVSTHAPARGRLSLPSGQGIRRRVSTHAPARGRPARRSAASFRAAWFQLTPPRGGDDGQRRASCLSRTVSTHAPARGRLSMGRQEPPVLPLFQLTPPRGGDGHVQVYPISGPCFNSRPREGATCGIFGSFDGAAVSTHAPARGRHRLPGDAGPGDPSFNSRPREGATLQPMEILVPVGGFNSRPREGATAQGGGHKRSVRSFNSRPREGATWRWWRWSVPRCCFNSRPREGATDSRY